MTDQKSEAAAPQTAAPAVTVSEDTSKTVAINRGVRAWVDKHVRNSPVARSTEAWNHLQKILPELAPLIEKEV